MDDHWLNQTGHSPGMKGVLFSEELRTFASIRNIPAFNLGNTFIYTQEF
jgi:hypothetical protein